MEVAVRPQTINASIKPTTVKIINKFLKWSTLSNTKSCETAKPITHFVVGIVL